MPPRAKTIEILLPFGDPRGLRVIHDIGRKPRLLVMPRPLFPQAESRLKDGAVGVYFLFGGFADLGEKQSVYVGEAENWYDRLKSHAADKDFWHTAVVVQSKEYTKTHGKYLESHAVSRCRKVDRFRLENKSSPAGPHVTESIEAFLEDDLDVIRELLVIAGFPVFESLRSADSERSRLFCDGPDAHGIGDYTADGMVVYAGSKARKDTKKGLWKGIVAMREKLIQEGVLVEDGVSLRFQKDWRFGSPSGASDMILGRSSNGWDEWVNEDGRTLDELVRKPAAGQA